MTFFIPFNFIVSPHTPNTPPSVPSFYVVTIGSILWCSFNSFHKSPIQTSHKQYKKSNMVKLLLFMMNMKQKYLTFYLLDSLAFLGGKKTPTPALHKTPKVISQKSLQKNRLLDYTENYTKQVLLYIYKYSVIKGDFLSRKLHGYIHKPPKSRNFEDFQTIYFSLLLKHVIGLFYRFF